MFQRFLFIGLLLLGAQLLRAQDRQAHSFPAQDPYFRGISALVVDTTYTAPELVMDFFSGSCVTPSQISFSGSPSALGFFQGAGTDLGLPAGILLSTGRATDAVGPNQSPSAGSSLGFPGLPDLNIMAGAPTYDATILEFSFTSTEPELLFRYVFASEEYPEYVCASFNDVFAFFIQGPGLNGPFEGGRMNVARIPGDSLPVAINTVNPGASGSNGNPAGCTPPSGSLLYSQYYMDNTGGEHLQYDGGTVPLEARFTVVPGETYHVRIAVADGGDAIFDSGVFISIESLCGDSLLQPVAAIRQFQESGLTASLTGGAKYAYDQWSWDMGDGTIIVSMDEVQHTYSAPGIYTVRFVATNYCCSDTVEQVLYMGLPPVVTGAEVQPPVCAEDADGRIALEVRSSLGELSYTWSDGGTGALRTGLPSGIYFVTITDSSGQATEAGPFDLSGTPLTLDIQTAAPSVKSTLVSLLPAGGVPPYRLQWSDGSTAAQRNDLVRGQEYLVEVEDARGCLRTRTFRWGYGVGDDPGLMAWPNPAGASLRVRVPEEAAAGEIPPVLRVYNLLGQLWYEGRLPSGAAATLDIRAWPEGLYLLQLQEAEGRFRTILVQVQR